VTEITLILNGMEPGDPHAAAVLLQLVYDDLRRLAAHRLAHEANLPAFEIEDEAEVLGAEK